MLLAVISEPAIRTTLGWVWPAVSTKVFGGYVGYRVGIADGATWPFGIAGD